MAKPTPSKVSLKLLINKATKKVLYAEAGKDTVDFLCSILTLPMGTVIRLLEKEHDMVGCLSSLYQSIKSLNDDYIQPKKHKDTVLKPIAWSSSNLFPATCGNTNLKQLYKCWCNHNINYVTNKLGVPCPFCDSCMNVELSFVEAGAPKAEFGLVKGEVTYMVMDDLSVAPMSTISGITFLHKFNITDVAALEEKMVDLDMPKALKLLNASLKSKNALTAVFL